MKDYTAQARRSGWNLKAIAERWGMTPGGLNAIASNPKRRDWDALAGLPVKEVPK